MLYLFDIDGTLVDTAGAGMASLKEATLHLFGDEGPGLNLAGSTDLAIVSQIHAHFGMEFTRKRFEQYIDHYLSRLDWNLANGQFPGLVYDGVTELLGNLAEHPDASIGLLTGNTQGGAASKMRHFQLSNHFSFGAYGCDHADRNELGPIALSRASAIAGRNFTAQETWVIGDTPKDIDCAHAIGARCLAVATGYYTASQLADHGADQVVETLADAKIWS
jgi:phosphoglycolate phosphatase